MLAFPFIKTCSTSGSEHQHKSIILQMITDVEHWGLMYSINTVLLHTQHCRPTLYNTTQTLKLQATYTVEPGYNDIGLYDTSLIASDILWYQLIPRCYLNIVLLVYNDTKYSVSFVTL
jgi:hypothetical protein